MRWSSKVAVAAILGPLSLAFVLGVVRAQRVNPSRASRTGAAASKPKAVAKHALNDVKAKKAPAQGARGGKLVALDQQPPFWDVGVDWGLQLDAETQALYQQMANLFSTVNAVPNDRLNYYSAVNDPPNWTIQNWTGLVTGVAANGDGTYQVTVTANPCFAQSTTLVILSDYSEIYHVDQNNNATYVGFSDPNNWAGTIPGLVNM